MGWGGAGDGGEPHRRCRRCAPPPWQQACPCSARRIANAAGRAGVAKFTLPRLQPRMHKRRSSHTQQRTMQLVLGGPDEHVVHEEGVVGPRAHNADLEARLGVPPSVAVKHCGGPEWGRGGVGAVRCGAGWAQRVGRALRGWREAVVAGRRTHTALCAAPRSRQRAAAVGCRAGPRMCGGGGGAPRASPYRRSRVFR